MTWSVLSYTTDIACSIEFTEVVKVDIQKFDIESSTDCAADFLQYNANEVCNTIPPATTSFFLWPGSFIQFQADDTNSNSLGVELLFSQVNTDGLEIFPTSMSGPCAWDEIANHWYYDDYLPNMRCTISFSEGVKVYTRKFDIEGGDGENGECTKDGVTLGVYTYCNSLLPQDYPRETPDAFAAFVGAGGTIEFFSDGEIQGEGFRFAILPWSLQSHLPTKHPSDNPSRTPSIAPTSTIPSTDPSNSPTLPLLVCTLDFHTNFHHNHHRTHIGT